MFDTILLNIILITFPLVLYLFYLAYSQNLKKDERNLFLDVALISSTYLAIKFQVGTNMSISMILLNVPLLLAYINNRQLSIFILTGIIINVYYGCYGWNIIILLIEYLVYYLLAILLIKKHRNNYLYISFFFVIKLFIFCFLIFINGENFTSICCMIGFYGLAFLSVICFSVMMFNMGTKIIKLHMTLKELEQDSQVKTSLFKITHEIKNPIAVCKGYLDMFDVNNKDHSKKYIPIIKEEIDRTLLLLQDFLSLTKVTIERDIIDINLLLEDVVSNYDLLLKVHNIKLVTSLIDDEIYINGDYNRLRQVFINIIKNSVEAILNNGNIDITSKVDNNDIIIIIKDDGVGISSNDIKKIDIPFYTTKKNGSGLGVSLSYEIIKAHGGSINYMSKLGEGTSVTIVLNILK